VKLGDLVRVMHSVELWTEGVRIEEEPLGGKFVGLFKYTEVGLIIQSDVMDEYTERYKTWKVCTSKGIVGWVHDERRLMKVNP